MNKLLSIFSICLLTFCSVVIAQVPQPDRIATNKGDLVIQPILHGTLALSWNDLTIYVDPYGGAERFEGIEDPDIIFITDIHGDHLNQNTLDALNLESCTIIAPSAVIEKLPEAMQSISKSISNGESMKLNGISVDAIPMYNLPESPESRHPKGRGNGYILTMGGKKVYLSGDTEDIAEMRALKNIDVAFICMNLPYTMDIDQAASAVNEFKPKIVYPYHYRGSGGLSDVESFQWQVTSASPDVEVRLRNWYSE